MCNSGSQRFPIRRSLRQMSELLSNIKALIRRRPRKAGRGNSQRKALDPLQKCRLPQKPDQERTGKRSTALEKELLWKRLTTLYLQKVRSICMKSDDKTIKTGFGEKARVLEDNRDILPLLLPSVTKPTFQRIIYQLWSEWSDGETKFCIFSLELEAILKMLFVITINYSSNKFPPIPGKSASIWCVLDNEILMTSSFQIWW